MISDEERKKAVKFLRERECIKLDCHECYQMSEMVLGRQNALCAIDEQWGALADLIDRPTCENVHDGREFECSECGMQWHLLDRADSMEEWAHVRRPKFCPSCGKEVVSHAERRD